MAGRRARATELLLIEEADAWFEYLEATRGQTASRYAELEPWAWARLTPAPARRSDARRARLRAGRGVAAARLRGPAASLSREAYANAFHIQQRAARAARPYSAPRVARAPRGDLFTCPGSADEANDEQAREAAAPAAAS